MTLSPTYFPRRGFFLALSTLLVVVSSCDSGGKKKAAGPGTSDETLVGTRTESRASPAAATKTEGRDSRTVPGTRPPSKKRDPIVRRLIDAATTGSPKGTDLNNASNVNQGSTTVVDVIGVGGGAAGAYGYRYGKGALARHGGSSGAPPSPRPVSGEPPSWSASDDPKEEKAEEPPEDESQGVRAEVENILARLARRKGETPDAMFFRYWGDNPFVDSRIDSLSTFSVDVDTASYTLTRAYLSDRGILPPAEAVRTEEFVNFFRGGHLPPEAQDGAAFAVHTEVAPSRYSRDKGCSLLRIGVKGRDVVKSERKAFSVVLVIDTSGSMRQGDRLDLVKSGLRLLVENLDEGDTLAIVSFDTSARTILEPTSASETTSILAAIDTLEPAGSTNANAGLTLGYSLAARMFREAASNRVMLLSDGVANSGSTTSEEQMLENVRTERKKGIYLSCIGVGMGNHNDRLLEQLADRGDGHCVYVDRLQEARRVFVEELTGTLQTIARDVKIQVEFDPRQVLRYRQIGYENRALADAEFRDNEIDAGEVGAGHEVTALYEIKCAPDAKGPLARVRVRYLDVEHGEAVELEQPVPGGTPDSPDGAGSPRLRLSACAAELAEVLRDSYWSRGTDLLAVAGELEELVEKHGAGLGRRDDIVELAALARKSAPLVRLRTEKSDTVSKVVDALRENQLLRVRLQTSDERRAADTRHLEELRRQNEKLRRQLEELFDRRRLED